jgi:Flp pilus assembly protein TadG
MGMGARRLGLNNGEGPGNPERGAAMVEMAFVFVLLVMLLVGITNGAIALGRNNSIQNAAREASRFGATLPDGGTASWFTEVRDVARSAAVGDLDASVSNEEICIAFITAEDVATHVIDDGGVLSGVTGGKCPGFDDGRDDNSEARVNLVVKRDTPFNVVVFSTDLTLVAEAGARYER